MDSCWTDYLAVMDDYIVWGPSEEVPKESEQFSNRFDCDNMGEAKEYVGCKIGRNKKDMSITFTGSVLFQSFRDKFGLMDKKPKTPAEVGSLIEKA
eukprot:7494044-Ditylum_brightwellii.AAC.1